jgi:hypothetical protein
MSAINASVWRLLDCVYLPRDGDKLPSLSATLKANGRVWTVVLVGEQEFGIQEWADALRASLAFTHASVGMDIASLGCSPAQPDDELPPGVKPS